MPQYMTTPNSMFQRQKPRIPSDIREGPEQGPISIYHPAHATPRGIMANRALARSVKNAEFRDDMYRQKAEARGSLWNSNRDQERIGLRSPSMQARMDQDYANVMEGRPSMNSVKSPINSTSQNRMVAARGLNYGSDPRYKQDSPDAFTEAPQPGEGSGGRRFFESYGGSGGFAAGVDRVARDGRITEVSNSPITGGLRLVGRGPSTRPSLDQEGLAARQERATAAQEQRSASLQNRRDSRILAAQRMYGLSDSTPAVAEAMARQGGGQTHAASVAQVNEHNAAVRDKALEFLSANAGTMSHHQLEQAKAQFQGMMMPVPERPAYKRNFGKVAKSQPPQLSTAVPENTMIANTRRTFGLQPGALSRSGNR